MSASQAMRVRNLPGNCHRRLTVETRHTPQIGGQSERRIDWIYRFTLCGQIRSLGKVCTIQARRIARRQSLLANFVGKLLVSYTIDPQPDVPTGMTPKAQCAFEILALNVSAIRAT